MKKYWKYLASTLVVLLAFTFVACSKNEPVMTGDLVGTWKVVKVNDFTVFGEDIEYYRFRADGTALVVEFDEKNGQVYSSVEMLAYKRTGDKIVLRERDGDTESVTIVKLTDDMLIIKDNDKDRVELVRVPDSEIAPYIGEL